MKVLSLNCGSTSLRWGLFDTARDAELGVGALENVDDIALAFRRALPEFASLAPDAVGHRIVHGGARFTEATRIDDEVLREIEGIAPLAPVHNPRCLAGVQAGRSAFPDLPHVAVFDTAFHQSMSPAAHQYALPHLFAERDGIRRFGFHGTSHRYAAERAARLLDVPTDRFTGVTVHLGGGCSVAAILDGRSVDTSMGMTPLEGLMMGTRSGDVDPAVVLDLAAREGLGPERVKTILNEESGLLGVSGLSSDLRELERAAQAGHERAQRALDMFTHRTRRGIGAALGVLGRADAIVLTGGIGEHAANMRGRILGDLEGLGIALDREVNARIVGREGAISTARSAIALFVVPAREAWLIARETAAALA